MAVYISNYVQPLHILAIMDWQVERQAVLLQTG
jgi:hypothetical protein